MKCGCDGIDVNLKDMLRRRKLLALALILLLSFVPFPTTIIPDWQLRFVDESGTPIPGVWARISCYHYSYGNENRCPDDLGQTSDANGYVKFPGQSVWLGVLPRIALTAFAYLTLIAHGSVGISAYVVVSTPDGFRDLPPVDYRSSPQVVTVKHEK